MSNIHFINFKRQEDSDEEPLIVQGQMRCQEALLEAVRKFGSSFKCKTKRDVKNIAGNLYDMLTIVPCEDESLELGTAKYPENFTEPYYLAKVEDNSFIAKFLKIKLEFLPKQKFDPEIQECLDRVIASTNYFITTFETQVIPNKLPFNAAPNHFEKVLTFHRCYKTFLTTFLEEDFEKYRQSIPQMLWGSLVYGILNNSLDIPEKMRQKLKTSYPICLIIKKISTRFTDNFFIEDYYKSLIEGIAWIKSQSFTKDNIKFLSDLKSKIEKDSLGYDVKEEIIVLIDDCLKNLKKNKKNKKKSQKTQLKNEDLALQIKKAIDNFNENKLIFLVSIYPSCLDNNIENTNGYNLLLEKWSIKDCRRFCNKISPEQRLKLIHLINKSDVD